MSIKIRPATLSDLAHITEIQNHVYTPDLVESSDIFAGIIAHNMSIVAEDTKINKIIGFLLAHPTELDYVHLLNHHPSVKISHPGDKIFLHDMSILPSYHKKKIGSSMFDYFKNAHQNSTMQLVSVNNTYKFWQKMGFNVKNSVPLTEEHFQNYASHEIFFMERSSAMQSQPHS